MTRSKTSRAWLHSHVTDPYVRLARKEGFRSRAAYKLRQIAERDRLFRPGMTVIDLGAAPGGWSQVAAAAVGARGRVIALDMLDMPPVTGVTFIRGDFEDEETLGRLEEVLAGHRADLVLSDMAPHISGVAPADQARAMRLAQLVLGFALKHLKPQGNLLVKVFQGAGFDEFLKAMRGCFVQVLVRKPPASRGRSSEVYLLGKGLRAGATQPSSR